MSLIEEKTFRRATINDAKALADLAANAFPGYPFTRIYDPEQVAQGISGGEYRIVAEMPTLGIVATAVLGLGSVMAEVKREIVAMEQRGNGIASDMTAKLVEDAKELDLICYTDARADQPGMQRAALKSGQKAYSLEPGKHVVYSHNEESVEKGPARETMVHLSSLILDENDLFEQLQAWPHEIREYLLANLWQSFAPEPKDPHIAASTLTNPERIAANIHDKLASLDKLNIVTPDQDIEIIFFDHSSLMIIKPDASGFITSLTKNGLPTILTIGERAGLQVITYYGDVDDVDEATMLFHAGMKPVMIRPWKKDYLTQAGWQVGWQKTMNDYENCLHGIKLHPEVEDQLKKFYQRLESHII